MKATRLALAAAASLSIAGMFEPLHDLGGTPPGQGKKSRLPKPARPTTQPDGESRQVRRARERAEATHVAGKDWRQYLAARKAETAA